MAITHSTVVAVADDGTSPVGSDEWNAAHTIAGSLSWDGATVTTSTPLINLTQTWNASGVTFTAIKANVTNTASAAGSLLQDLQIGGNSIFSVDKAATSELKNSTNAASLRVYNTYTDASNYERGIFDWTTNANTLTIGTDKAGTGTARDLKLAPVSNLLRFAGVGGTNAITTNWENAAGSTVAALDAGNALFYIGEVELANASWRRAITVINTSVMAWSSTGARSGTADLGFSRVAANVLGIGTGAQGNAGGWLQWAGQVRVTGDVSFTSTATLAIITGLTVALQAGRTYAFEAFLPFTCIAAGGARAGIVASGGLTATNIIYDGWIVDSAANGIKGNTQATALGTAVGAVATTGAAGHIMIRGMITVNVAGSLQVHGAQGVSNATATVFKRGCYLQIMDVP